MTGAPGWKSWITVVSAITSAWAIITVPAAVAGEVTLEIGMLVATTGMPLRAHVSAASVPSGSRRRGVAAQHRCGRPLHGAGVGEDVSHGGERRRLRRVAHVDHLHVLGGV